jgi:hypothetical protein
MRVALAVARDDLVRAVRRGLLKPHTRDKLSYVPFDLVEGLSISLGGHLGIDNNAPMERYAELRNERLFEDRANRERQKCGQPLKSHEVWFRTAELRELAANGASPKSYSTASPRSDSPRLVIPNKPGAGGKKTAAATKAMYQAVKERRVSFADLRRMKQKQLHSFCPEAGRTILVQCRDQVLQTLVSEGYSDTTPT